MNLENYIFAILKDKPVKLSLFINFKVLFPVVSKFFIAWPT